MKLTAKPLLAGAVGALASLSLASAAFAAGSGYGTPSPGATPPGGFTSVAASETFSSSGGTLNASLGSGTNVQLQVPAGDFTTPVQVSLYAPSDLSAVRGAIAGIRIVFSTTYGSTLAHPIVIVIKSPSITAVDVVEEYSAQSGSFVPYPQAQVAPGSATIDVTSDPTFVVASSSSPTVPGATTPSTGVPVGGLLLAGGGLVIAGGGLLALRRRLARTQ